MWYGSFVEVSEPIHEINGRKKFSYDQIDEAISTFKQLAFNPQNLCYKQHEAIINLYNKGIELDLEIEEDFKMMETERLALINSNEIQ